MPASIAIFLTLAESSGEPAFFHAFIKPSTVIEPTSLTALAAFAKVPPIADFIPAKLSSYK